MLAYFILFSLLKMEYTITVSVSYEKKSAISTPSCHLSTVYYNRLSSTYLFINKNNKLIKKRKGHP